MSALSRKPGTVYMAAPARYQMEIVGPDWKLVGYVKDIKLSQDNDYEDSQYFGFGDLYLQDTTYTISATFDTVDGIAYKLLTGAPVEEPKHENKLRKVLAIE